MSSNSFIDNYTKAIAPTLRRLNDHQIKIQGVEINALVLKVTERNKLGDQDTEIKESKTINARIIYPGNRVTLFRNRDESGNLIEDNAIFLEDILPIELYVPIEETFTVEENNILVHCLVDEKNNVIPQVFEVARSTGMFNNRELIAKIFILSNIRDILNEDIRNQIANFTAEYKRTYNL